MSRTPELDLDDAFLRERVDRALEPYQGVLSEAALREMRTVLEDALLTHPLGVTLMQRARPREARAKSDERARKDVVDPPDGAARGDTVPLRGRNTK